MKKPKQFTVAEFMAQYATEDACLEKVWQLRYGGMEACPGCAVVGAKYYRLKKRKCYECGQCGHHIYPLAGTVMHGSTTKLTTWFYVMYLFSTCKNGVSAKEVQRQTGVTYKCAWRIGHAVRRLMGRSGEKLRGIVEADEALIGGRAKGKRGWGAGNKTCVFGMVEKGEGGRARTTVVSRRKSRLLLFLIGKHVERGSTLHTDEFRAYRHLPLNGYGHESVCHSRYEWRRGDCHTNTIEGRWSNLKKALRGTFTFVSQKWMQAYLDEFDFRYNNRLGCAFLALLERISLDILLSSDDGNKTIRDAGHGLPRATC